MLCAMVKTISCYSEYCRVSLFPRSSCVYLQRRITWQLHFMGCGANWNRPIGKVCFFSSIFCINKHQSRLDLKHSQKVYDRNLQAMTQCFHPLQPYSTQSIQIYLQAILITIQLDATVCSQPSVEVTVFCIPDDGCGRHPKHVE